MNEVDAIVKEIVINAPAEQVFQAIVDPLQRVQWWGREGRFQATQMKSDLRPGGKWRMTGTAAAGKPFAAHGEYRVVDPPRLLEWTWIADWHENEPATLVRFDLEEKDGVTIVRLTHSGFATQHARDSYQGWPWLLALLQAHVHQQLPIEASIKPLKPLHFAKVSP
jgi:uncharacterized protein YndB with AHSA1/START domain